MRQLSSFRRLYQSGNKEGAAVLITVLITTVVILAIALSLVTNAITESEIGTYQSKSVRAFANTDGCVEESLIRLHRKNDYTGETLTLDSTSCIIAVSGSGSTRTISVTSTNSTYTKVFQITVTISPSFTITSWQEITN